MAKNKLTDKQRVFCNMYLSNGFNGTQASIKAGYSKKTAMQMATENLGKPYIREYLNEQIDLMLDNKQELTKQWIDECKKYAFMSDLEMETTGTKPSDKKGFMDLLGKYLTLFADKRDLKITTIDKDGKEIGISLSPADRKKRIKELEAKLNRKTVKKTTKKKSAKKK